MNVWRGGLTFAAITLVAAHPTLAEETSTANPPAVAFSSFDPQVTALLAQMTLEEKIGQMTQPELSQLGDLTDIAEYCVGSVLSGGDSDPQAGNSAEAWSDVYDRCQQQQALKTRLSIPLLYGIDAVHGHNNVL